MFFITINAKRDSPIMLRIHKFINFIEKNKTLMELVPLLISSVKYKEEKQSWTNGYQKIVFDYINKVKQQRPSDKQKIAKNCRKINITKKHY